MIYPYLGAKTNDKDDSVIVFFTEPNKGVVVSDETGEPENKFGRYGSFNEDDFGFLQEGICVRLNN